MGNSKLENRLCRFCYLDANRKNRILYTTDNFYVLLARGPICEGYLLLISKKHYASSADIPKEMMDEFLNLKERIKRILIKEYGSCMFYEHGRIPICLNLFDNKDSEHSGHCYHMHMHAVPTSISLKDEISKDFDSISIKEISDFDHNTIKEYLFYEERGKKYIFIVNSKPRSQYLRFLLAKKIGNERLANWEKFPRRRTIEKAKKRMKKYFEGMTLFS